MDSEQNNNKGKWIINKNKVSNNNEIKYLDINNVSENETKKLNNQNESNYNLDNSIEKRTKLNNSNQVHNFKGIFSSEEYTNKINNQNFLINTSFLEENFDKLNNQNQSNLNISSSEDIDKLNNHKQLNNENFSFNENIDKLNNQNQSNFINNIYSSGEDINKLSNQINSLSITRSFSEGEFSINNHNERNIEDSNKNQLRENQAHFQESNNNTNSSDKKKSVRIYSQNVKSINDNVKKEFMINTFVRKKIDILVLTETWEHPDEKYGCKNLIVGTKTITASGTSEEYKGQGVAVIVKYPLAQNVIQYNIICGRVIRILFKRRKQTPIALYAMQAPTAPYGAGYQQTIDICKQIDKLIIEDTKKSHGIIICGDMNSYSDKLTDYQGNGPGQSPSALIKLFCKFELVDIFRVINPIDKTFTFRNTIMQSRLDHFWLSSNIIKCVKKTSIGEFTDIISDHAPIFLDIEWKSKKFPSSKFTKTIWNNKHEQKIQEWSQLANSFCDNFLSDTSTHDNSIFNRKYDLLMKKFSKLARKIFWIKKRRKRNDKPPIWLYVMRKIRKAEKSTSDDEEKKVKELIMKYFPSINVEGSFQEIRSELKVCAKQLENKKKNDQIKKAIRTRFEAFGKDIKRHLNSILERDIGRVDTSFFKDGDNFISNEKEVKEYFFNYYKNLFGNEEWPEDEELYWSEEHVISFEVNEQEVSEAVNACANNKAAGISGLIIEMLKCAGPKIITWITNAFNYWIKNQSIPQKFLRSQIWLIPKGIYNGDVTNTRPINLIECLRKVISTIFVRRINAISKENTIFKGINYGFREGKSTGDAIKCLQIIKEDANKFLKPLIVIYLDVKKAYDSVNPISIKQSLAKLGFDQKYWQLLENSFQQRQMRIITQAGPTKFFTPNTGLEQGEPSSPVLWNIFYELLLQKLSQLKGYKLGNINVSYLAYADDLTLIASNDNDMQILLSTVCQFLKQHRMEIQPKKSIVTATYQCRDFSISNEEETTTLSRVCKKISVKYLGVPIALTGQKGLFEQTMDEVKQMLSRVGNKKISSCIAKYIINAVILPIVSYRIQGCAGEKTFYKKINSLCAQFIKKCLNLPKGFPHSLLHSGVTSVNLRNIKDLHEEQEISNFLMWINSEDFTGELVRQYMEKITICHPVFTGPAYLTKSKYSNWIWSVIQVNNLQIMSAKEINQLKNGSFSCQHLNFEPHDKQTKTLCKYNVIQSKQFLSYSRRNNGKLKAFESLAKSKDKQLGLEVPEVLKAYYEDEQNVLVSMKEPKFLENFELIDNYKQQILKELPEIETDNQSTLSIFTDGSYIATTSQGGSAAIIVDAKGKEVVKVQKQINHCCSSTNAEMIAAFLGIVINQKYPFIVNLYTDSMAVIHGMEREVRGKNVMKEQFNFWLNEIRKEKQHLPSSKFSWVKGHSTNIGNIMADAAAKEAASLPAENVNYFSKSGPVSYFLWSNNNKVEGNVRQYLKEYHVKKHETNLLINSKRLSNLLSNANEIQVEIWKKAMRISGSQVNTSIKQDNFLRYLLKATTLLLPTGENLKSWKLIDSDICTNCGQRETIEHILEGHCQEESLWKHLNSVILKWVKSSNVPASISRWMPQEMITRWSKQNALGIIHQDILNRLVEEKISKPKIINLVKNLFNVGYYLWTGRCQQTMSLGNFSPMDIPDIKL